jgi:hypothetical protein
VAVVLAGGLGEDAVSIWATARTVFSGYLPRQICRIPEQHVIPKLLTAVKQVYYAFKKHRQFLCFISTTITVKLPSYSALRSKGKVFSVLN